MVSPASPVKRGQNRLAQQPADLREGVTNAYQVFREVSGDSVVLCLKLFCLILGQIILSLVNFEKSLALFRLVTHSF